MHEHSRCRQDTTVWYEKNVLGEDPRTRNSRKMDFMSHDANHPGINCIDGGKVKLAPRERLEAKYCCENVSMFETGPTPQQSDAFSRKTMSKITRHAVRNLVPIGASVPPAAGLIGPINSPFFFPAVDSRACAAEMEGSGTGTTLGSLGLLRSAPSPTQQSFKLQGSAESEKLSRSSSHDETSKRPERHASTRTAPSCRGILCPVDHKPVRSLQVGDRSSGNESSCRRAASVPPSAGPRTPTRCHVSKVGPRDEHESVQPEPSSGPERASVVDLRRYQFSTMHSGVCRHTT